MTSKVKVESGLQLLARLTKKPQLENFYPLLFGTGPKAGNIIEIYSENSTNCLLADLIAESLIPLELGGSGASVVIFSTDGNLDLEYILNVCKNKLKSHSKKNCQNLQSNIETLVHAVLRNIYIFNIYDTTQFYVTIQNLENLLSNNSNISLVVFDTLTAFYWCEQSFKITKMDLYIKKILNVIWKIVKDYNVTVMYTRSEHFSSSKELIENLEMCGEQSKEAILNYRIQITYNENGTHHVNIRTHDKQFRKEFLLKEDEICWL